MRKDDLVVLVKSKDSDNYALLSLKELPKTVNQKKFDYNYESFNVAVSKNKWGYENFQDNEIGDRRKTFVNFWSEENASANGIIGVYDMTRLKHLNNALYVISEWKKPSPKA